MERQESNFVALLWRFCGARGGRYFWPLPPYQETHLDATRINGCEECHTGPHCKLQDLRKQYRRISKCAKRGSEPAEFIQPIREGLESEEVRCPTVHATCSLSGSRERYEIPISQFEPKGL